MGKKYILSLVLLISACSLFAMKPSKTKPKEEKKEKGDKKKDLQEREVKRAAFWAALADGKVSLESSWDIGDHLKFPDLRGKIEHLSVGCLDTFIPAALETLGKMGTLKKTQRRIPGITEGRAYALVAAHIIFIQKSDLREFKNPKFEAHERPEFKGRSVDYIRRIFTGYREGLLGAMQHNQVDNLKRVLALPMQPWDKPLHLLVLEKLESGELERAE